MSAEDKMMISVTEGEDGKIFMTIKEHGQKERKIPLERTPSGLRDSNGYLYPLEVGKKH